MEALGATLPDNFENNLEYSNLSPNRGQLVIANTVFIGGTPVSSEGERLIFEITFADSPVGQMYMPLDMFLSINKLKHIVEIYLNLEI